MPDIEEQIASCDSLPIHAPGYIQAYGALFGFNSFGKMTWLSQNIAAAVAHEYPRPFEFNPALLFEGFQPDRDMTGIALDVPLSEFGRRLFQGYSWASVRSFESGPNIVFEMEPTRPTTLVATRAAHASSSFPRKSASETAMLAQFLKSATAFNGCADELNTPEILQNLCSYIAVTAGFDRVMAYRFAADGSGEVVVEHRKQHLQPFLHLHYPASDVPSQVRRLYIENGGRCIFDATQQGFPVLCNASNQREATLDLSKSQLRGVSVIHAQYLRNMGVKSSFSVPIHFGNTLWGLIACHNYQEELSECAPTYKHRYFIAGLAHVFAGLIDGAESESRKKAAEILRLFWSKESDQTGQAHHGQLLKEPNVLLSLMQLLRADGLILRQNDQFMCTGDALVSFATELSRDRGQQTTNELNAAQTVYSRLLEFSNKLFDALGNGVATEEALAGVTPGLHSRLQPQQLWENSKLPELREFAGMLIAQLQLESTATQFLFLRKAATTELLWAGQKGNETINLDTKFYLSPRRSFEIWKELRTAAALPWLRSQQTIAADLFVALCSQSTNTDLKTLRLPSPETARAKQLTTRQLTTRQLTDVRNYFKELVFLLEPLANELGTRIILSFSEDVPSHIAVSHHQLDKVFFSLFIAYFEGRLGETLARGGGTTIRLIVNFKRPDPSKVSLLDLEILAEFKEVVDTINPKLHAQSLLELFKLNHKLSALGAELKFSKADHGQIFLERTTIRIPGIAGYFRQPNAHILEFQKIASWQRDWNSIMPLNIIVLTEFSSALAELCETLKNTAHNVFEARKPFEVFALARTNPIDAILSDSESLNSEVYPLAKILRENPETAQIPLLFVSDYSQSYLATAEQGRFGTQPLLSLSSLLFTLELKEIAKRKHLQQNLRKTAPCVQSSSANIAYAHAAEFDS